jgi:predicted nucleic acid-binding protein
LQLTERYQVSYWDAAIIAAALDLGCGSIYTEDLSDGQAYGGVKVVNPFLGSL